jgi:hypothetical protein
MGIDLTQAVFTTRYVLENNSPIIYVSHDKEGDWQFFGKEDDLTEKDARIITLGEIIALEPLLNKILWIPEGMQAWLNIETQEWITSV